MYRNLIRAVILFPALLAGCSNESEPLGKVVDHGRITVDIEELAASFKAGCGAGDVGACANLGVAYIEGAGVPRDQRRGAALLLEACDQGHSSGCVNLGRAFVDGIGVPLDPERAVSLFRQACDEGVATGCFNLGVAYWQGKGVEQDLAAAAELYEQVCDTGAGDACYNLGYAYSRGEGVDRDLAKAAELFERACKAGVDRACADLRHVRNAPIDDFRQAVANMNNRSQSVAGVRLFEDAEMSGDGSVKVIATETWDVIPEEAKVSYANALYVRWQTAAKGLEPLNLRIIDPSGNIVMERPGPI